MKAILTSIAAFLLSLAAGRLLTASWSTQEDVPPAVGGATALVNIEAKAAKRPILRGSGTPAQAVLPERIAWERRIWQMDSEGLAQEFTSLLRTAASSERAFRVLTIWRERDPDGLIAWARQQPETISFGEAGSKISLTHEVLKAAVGKDPEYAWRIAAELAGNPHVLDINRGQVIGHLLERDVEGARAFVIKHRDEIAAFGQGHIGWYNHDPQKALPVALELPPGPVRTSIIAELARYYGSRPDAIVAAREWFGSLPPEHRKEVGLLPHGRETLRHPSFYRISETHRNQLKEAWPVAE